MGIITNPIQISPLLFMVYFILGFAILKVIERMVKFLKVSNEYKHSLEVTAKDYYLIDVRTRERLRRLSYEQVINHISIIKELGERDNEKTIRQKD